MPDNETVVPPQENTGAESVEQEVIQENQKENTDATGDEAKIKQVVEFLGGIPKGMEFVMHKGKPHLHGKVEGRPFLKSIDDIIRDFSMSEAAEEKLSKAKSQEKALAEQQAQTQTLIKNLLTNPEMYFNLLRQNGYNDKDINDFLAYQLEKAIKDAETPREIREARTWQQKAEELQRKLQEKEELENQNKFKAEGEKKFGELRGELYEALEKNGVFNEKTSEEFKQQVAYTALYWMDLAEQQGIKDFTAEKAVKRVMKSSQDAAMSIWENLPDHLILKMTPDNVIKAIERALKGGLKVTPTSNSLTAEAGSRPNGSGKKPKEKMSINDYFSKY